MEEELLHKSDYNDKVLSSKDTNGDVNHSGDGPIVNGFSNGLNDKSVKKEEHRDKHRDKHKDKHRDKDREREKDRHREKDREKDKSRDKEREREKDKHKDHKSSSHKSSNKDKERKDKDKPRDKDKERDKEAKDKDSSSSHKDKDKSHSSSSGSKHHSSSSSSKDKHKSSSGSISKDKEKDRHKDRDKDKEKEKDKERHRDKDKDREKDKSRHSSSSKDKERKDKSFSAEKSKDHHKDRSSSSHKEKYEKSHREKEIGSTDHDSKLKVKKRIFDDSDDEQEIKEVPIQVKEEFEVKEEEEEEDEEYNPGEVNESQEIKDEPEDEFDETNDDTTFDASRVKTEDESVDDDLPLSCRAPKREPSDYDDDDDVPLAKKKIKKEKDSKKKRKKGYESEEEYNEYDDEEDFKPKKQKKVSTKKVKTEQPGRTDTSLSESPTKRKKKGEEEHEVWKWWEEEKKDGKVKWTFLEHKGPVFAPPYERLPSNVKFHYEGKEMQLSDETEEVATFYARMLEHDYVTKEVFNKNFFKCWRKVMTLKEKETITDLSKCNFKPMHAYFVQKSEERKSRTKEEKKALKEENERMIEEFGFCVIDGHKEKIGNFRLEPPGLFRGRGEHPKMGMLKVRLRAEDIIINCSKDSDVPKPPDGHRWKEVRHDNLVTWLASWTENVQGQVKYIMLNPSSKLKGEKDWQKYETARKLAKCIDKIRREYKEDWKSKEMRIRQRAVALYFIDKLALRAGNEKDEDQADTVGCCSLRVEHIELHPERDGKEFLVVFDFLGKDSIRYYNEVPVEKRVFKNLQLFVEGKKPADDLFDRLNTQILNKHLNELMEGLTAKVFRTYNASITLQQQLNLLTDAEYSLPEKILAYNRANRAVAILCNHQRSIPKSHQKSMDNLKEKIAAKKDLVDEAEKQYKNAKRDAKNGSAKERILCDKAKKRVARLKEQLTKLEVQETDKEENKTIALGTSKLNYLDPRISVAWCKKYDIPIDKVYNKTQRSKFRWAIDMVGPEFIF